MINVTKKRWDLAARVSAGVVALAAVISFFVNASNRVTAVETWQEDHSKTEQLERKYIDEKFDDLKQEIRTNRALIIELKDNP